MRRVVSSYEIYHLWAHQAQDEARTSHGNLSFYGTAAYSYGTVIGRVLTAPNGERAYLLDMASFSVSTSQHQSALQQAVGGLPNVFTVESGMRGQRLELTPTRIVELMLAPIPELLLKAKRARKRSEWYTRSATDALENAHTFATLFNMPAPAADFDALLTDLEEKTKAQAAEARIREAAYLAEQAEKNAELLTRLPRWLAGYDESEDGRRYNRYTFASLPVAYLRISPRDETGNTVETTKGAVVPTEHVRKAVPLILAYVNTGKEYKRNGYSIHLGPYVLDSIDADGTLGAGCHIFEKSEVLRFAAVLAARQEK